MDWYTGRIIFRAFHSVVFWINFFCFLSCCVCVYMRGWGVMVVNVCAFVCVCVCVVSSVLMFMFIQYNFSSVYSVFPQPQHTNVCFWYLPPGMRFLEDKEEKKKRLHKVRKNTGLARLVWSEDLSGEEQTVWRLFFTPLCCLALQLVHHVLASETKWLTLVVVLKKKWWKLKLCAQGFRHIIYWLVGQCFAEIFFQMTMAWDGGDLGYDFSHWMSAVTVAAIQRQQCSEQQRHTNRQLGKTDGVRARHTKSLSLSVSLSLCLFVSLSLPPSFSLSLFLFFSLPFLILPCPSFK